MSGPAIAAPAKPGGSAGPGKVPNYLAPLTPQQITQQATKTIGAAYAPSYQNLNQQETQAKAITDKRTADNKFYMSWLDTQSAALQAHADAANQQLSSLEQGLNTQQANDFSAQPGQLVNGANTRIGNVSNNSQSNAFGADLNASQDYNNAMLHGAGTAALQSESTTGSQLAGARANNFNVMANLQGKQQTDLTTALTKIADQRSTLQTKESSDIGKEIARLQGVQISVAQSNRNYDTAAAKLGISVANTNSEIATRQFNSQTARQNANTSLGRAQAAQMNADRTYQLNVDKYNAGTAKDLYEREHGLGPYRRSTAGQLTQSSQNTIYNSISKVQGELRQIIANGANAQQAYHVLLNGSSVNTDTGRDTAAGVKADQTNPNSNVGEIYRTKTYTSPDVQILNAAYNLETGRGLTSGDVAALQKMGLANPGQRLKVAAAAPAPTNTAANWRT